MISADDLAILDEFEFEIQPVGVKYLTQTPSDIELLDGSLTLCAMLKKAQTGDCFYAGPENHALMANGEQVWRFFTIPVLPAGYITISPG